MVISHDLLEKTCKNMIETILLSLSHATKGTVYRIGPMPKLQAVRVTSGIRIKDTDQIQWGLPEVSDYNFPGKTWDQYHDRPGHVLEAMGWCVEKQKSWTADNPYEDTRSVRKQIKGEIEDFHHMEPVLVRKEYLYGAHGQDQPYPLDANDAPIWKDSEYVVVAVIKIHFLPYSIHRGDRSTKIIKKLSRILGTELLSLHIRETLSEAQKDLARQRLQSCNVVAHELRTTLIKLGFIFPAINAELGFLREQWEVRLEKAFPDLDSKRSILMRLEDMLQMHLSECGANGNWAQLGEKLLADQRELARLSLLPQLEERWLTIKIRPQWRRLLEETPAWQGEKEEIQDLLERLEKVIWIGMDEDLAQKIPGLPDDLKRAWPKLAYMDFTKDKLIELDEILQLLDHPALDIPHKQQTKKILLSLKVLAEMVPEVEERANRIICSLRDGDLPPDC